MAERHDGAKYTLSRTETLVGWLLPLAVALGSIFGVFFVRGNFGEILRQYFLVK